MLAVKTIVAIYVGELFVAVAIGALVLLFLVA
jgi:hypothetical protein